MRSVEDIQSYLDEKTEDISADLKGADVVIVVAGSKKPDISRTITAWKIKKFRLRHLLGILETAKHIETLRHFKK